MNSGRSCKFCHKVNVFDLELRTGQSCLSHDYSLDVLKETPEESSVAPPRLSSWLAPLHRSQLQTH